MIMPSTTFAAGVLPIILALISSKDTSASTRLLHSGPCSKNDIKHQHDGHYRRLVAIPHDKTGRSYAPVCHDGQHVDTRRMHSCPEGQCWANIYQSCMDDQGATCKIQRQNELPINHNDGLPTDYYYYYYYSSSTETTRHSDPEDQDHNDDDDTQECGPALCWSPTYQSCFHVLSSECLNPPTGKPTVHKTNPPTFKPTFAMEITEHPVELILENVAPGYTLTREARAIVIRYAKEVIEMYLKEPMEFIQVTFAGYLDNDRRLTGSEWAIYAVQGRRRLKDLSVPLRVTLRGPRDTRDFALSYIMDILQDRLKGLVNELKAQDYDAFNDVKVLGRTYSEADIVEETSDPTGRPSPNPMDETVHPVKLIFRNLPLGYSLDSEKRASIIRFVKQLLRDDLDERLELIDLEYAGILIERVQSLPLLVTVWGPADVSALAPVLIMRIIEDNRPVLAQLLGAIDPKIFVDVGLSADSYDPKNIEADMFDPDDIVYATPEPSGSPTTTILTFPIETMAHPVKLVFNRAPPGYKFSAADKRAINRFLKKLLNEKLDPSMQVLMISNAGDRRILQGNRTRRWLQGGPPELPLLMDVEAPENVQEFVLNGIMEIIDDNMDDLYDMLNEIDPVIFEDPEVTVETFDPYDLLEPYMQPPEVLVEEPSIMSMCVWLLIGIGLLALICIIFFFCALFCRKPKDTEASKKETKVVEQQRQIPIHVEQQAVVEKPVYIKKPVYNEVRQGKEPSRMIRKKKKNTSLQIDLGSKLEIELQKILEIEQGKSLQIEYEKSLQSGLEPETVATATPFITVHDCPSTMTARSNLTFDVDPPSYDPYRSRLLNLSAAESPLTALAPSEQHLRILADPSAAYSVRPGVRYSAPAEPSGHAASVYYQKEGLAIENQSYTHQDSSGHRLNVDEIHNHFVGQPGVIGRDASAVQSYYGGNEPSGHNRAVLTTRQDQQSYFTQASSAHEEQSQSCKTQYLESGLNSIVEQALCASNLHSQA